MHPQQPSQTPPHHHHHHHHHHHCSPLINQHLHRHHNLFPRSVLSSSLCPALHHIHHHVHHHCHQFNPTASNLHFRPIPPHKFSSIPPNPCPVSASFSDGGDCSVVSTAAEILDSVRGAELQDLEPDNLGHGEEDLEDVFVLTDEWREFFAKSEAKRRMEKVQKNKHRR